MEDSCGGSGFKLARWNWWFAFSMAFRAFTDTQDAGKTSSPERMHDAFPVPFSLCLSGDMDLLGSARIQLAK